MQPENTKNEEKNLLLKFDAENENFHFVEH